MLRRNDDSDLIVRHGGIMALQALGKALPVVQLPGQPAAVRLATLIALRRGATGRDHVPGRRRTAHRAEAARAIADEHIDVAMPKLAKLAAQPKLGKSVMRRVLNATHASAGRRPGGGGRGGSTRGFAREKLNLLGAWPSRPGATASAVFGARWRIGITSAAAAWCDKIDGLLRNATGVVQRKPSARFVGCVWRKPVRRCWRL